MAESAYDDKHVPKDFSRTEIIQMAENAIQDARGTARVYFKFTCQHCGQRCTFSEPNKLYEKGECFSCGKETQIQKAGFMLIISSPKHQQDGTDILANDPSVWNTNMDM